MFRYELSDMPGPSVEAQQLQLAQIAAMDAVYDAFNAIYKESPHLKHADVRQMPTVVAANKVYDETIAKLEQLLGSDAHCAHVDTELWSMFSDCYKDEVGCRPRFHQTRAQVLAWFEWQKTKEPSKESTE